MTSPAIAGGLGRAAILNRVTALMRRDLKLGNDIAITESTPFVGGDADIDSLDILLMLASIERDFAIKIPSAQIGARVFQNVGTLVDYLAEQLDAKKDAADFPVSKAAGDFLDQLPHRPPFRFVTRLAERVPGQSALGAWSVTGDEDFLKGHFPSRPIVPGVLIAEALAQLSGLAANSASEGRLAQMDVRFDASVIPPAEIELRSRVTRKIGLLTQYEVEATYQGKSVARGLITLSWPTANGAGAP